MICKVRWNPGAWPFVTHCVRPEGHEGDHTDSQGRTCPNVPGQEEED